MFNKSHDTDQLCSQVHRAVEALIQSLDRAIQDQTRAWLTKVPEPVLYESALTVMMRLVFLFSAEERGLLPLGNGFYDQHYAVSILMAQLQKAADQQGEELLEGRFDAWVRLLSTFRAVFGGVRNKQMNLPAYGGGMFDPDRFPFLEGRETGTSWRKTPANPLPVNNRTVLHLLRSLQYLEMQGVTLRLNFRDLDITQVGHLYESQLDHTARRAVEPMLGLVGPKGKYISLSKLESLEKEGDEKLVRFLCRETGRSEKALRKALGISPGTEDIDRLRAACGNDDAPFRLIRPFAGLIRKDMFDRPVVIGKGGIYVTTGTDRRRSATHYTQTCLTEPIVRYALEPLVYVGPDQGWPKEEWRLRSPRELLDLKICDLACGSGAFLVQACRYLSTQLLEAWKDAETKYPGVSGITAEGAPATGEAGEVLIPKDGNERMIYAQRLVACRCLYGVDKNPLAIEMAKLSFWILLMAKDMPFSFLDHAIRHGDSLIGIHDIDQIRYFTLNLDNKKKDVFAGKVDTVVEKVSTQRKRIKAQLPDHVGVVEARHQLLNEAKAEAAPLSYAADMLLADEFRAARLSQKEDLQNAAAIQAKQYIRHRPLEEFKAIATQALNGQATFHWPLEFSEVFIDGGGFDAIVCNPPFVGGQKITGILGTSYRNYLINHLAQGKRGSADLSAYFFLRAKCLLKPGGYLGMLATNTIAQGDTREVGLDQLVAAGGVIYRAVPSRPWPGEATLEIAEVWIRNGGSWGGKFFLEDKMVAGITPFLTKPGRATGKAHRLAANADKSFQGSIVLGMGFVLTLGQARTLIARDERNRAVLFPYLNGEDVNSSPDQSPSRWVINFHDWPLERVSRNEWHSANEEQREEWEKAGLVSPDYDGPVAADYPECLRIIEEKVKPQRARRNEKGEFVLRHPLYLKWWLYGEKRPALYATIADKTRVLVFAQTSKTKYPTFVPKGMVYDQKLVVIATSNSAWFALLCSHIHYWWVLTKGSSLRTDAVYTPSDCFDTFPFPEATEKLKEIGERYCSRRQSIMHARQEGLTRTYNRFHDSAESARDIRCLRELHQEMDYAVTSAYGWTDLQLNHDFHETNQGARYTVSEEARRELLDRLLELNHQRYAEEVRVGLHVKIK